MLETPFNIFDKFIEGNYFSYYLIEDVLIEKNNNWNIIDFFIPIQVAKKILIGTWLP